MTQVTNPTTPVTSNPTGGGGSNIIGAQTDNRLNGTQQADIILTFGGNDVIAGGGGDDIIISGGGSDSIGGGSGNDAIFAGSGNDAVAGGDGDDRIFGGKGNDIIDGGAGNDLVSGDNGNDTVLGGSGNDTVFGGRGNDIVSGGDGNDSLYGGKDNDTVDGGAGNDFISGDRGSDVLTGGAGSDTFYFAGFGGDFGVDTITDFTPAEDKIVLKSGGVLGALGTGLDSSEFVVVSNFNAASSPGTANKLVYDPQNGVLYFNGTGGVLTIAQLQPGLTITSNNLELF
ncbi:calcium-binding protein [Tychonema sp. LEGE 07199]|uniref:calcium-binding protein n=1 Tax=unclassified Tychonema TaxID=2642144 RepID=UPI001882D197|nr:MULTISPECIES: calcium-binding protein [unclassified Tychonema]MBE9122033.1 calcium-binding protein [Tychonema sp. LEGE 07199]MBE9133226.1 calcium-binding protein [Tychonema sp. LEGE 07196]